MKSRYPTPSSKEGRVPYQHDGQRAEGEEDGVYRGGRGGEGRGGDEEAQQKNGKKGGGQNVYGTQRR